MKKLTLIIKALSLVTGLAAYSDAIPSKFVPVAALAFVLASTLKDAAIAVADYLDDKQLNGSFKP